MRAIVWTRYGPPDVLQLREIAKPVSKDHEVLIRIHASTVTAGDCEMRSLGLPIMLSLPMRAYIGVRRPTRVKILGQEFAGTIESVGKSVRRFREGCRSRAQGEMQGRDFRDWRGLRLADNDCRGKRRGVCV